MSYLAATGSMFSLTALMEMLCFASGHSCLSNVNMHSDSKLLIFFQSTSVTFSSVFPASPTPASLEQNFCMRYQIRLGYLTVWHFQRSQPLLVHLVPSMLIFVFDTGFCGAGCQRSGPRWDGWRSQSILSTPSEILPHCRCFFDLVDLICDPTIYSTCCRITVPADLWRDLPVHSEGSLTRPWAPKQERGKKKEKTAEQLTPSFSMSKIQYCSFASLRLNFLQSARQRAPVLQRAGLSFAAYFCHGQTMRIRRLLL